MERCSCNEMEVIRESDDKLTRTIRKEAPSHYTLEIESLRALEQILLKPKVDRYESPEFEASGHSWRLILYPNGDSQRNGADHISLYLEIMDIQKPVPADEQEKKPRPAREIDALLIFFVYDYKNEQYISFQDGKVKRFSALQTEWGFSRLIPLKEFMDTSNGYLLSDDRHGSSSCKFGVEVFVLGSESKGESFCTIDNPKTNSFSWTIERFSKLREATESSDFTVGDYKWKLRLYAPKQKEEEKKKEQKEEEKKKEQKEEEKKEEEKKKEQKEEEKKEEERKKEKKKEEEKKKEQKEEEKKEEEKKKKEQEEEKKEEERKKEKKKEEEKKEEEQKEEEKKKEQKEEEYVSIFLYLQESQKVLTDGRKMHVEFKLQIKDQSRGNSNSRERKGNGWFSSFESGGLGFRKFIKLSDLKQTHGLIVYDDMIVEAEITSISITKDLPPKPQDKPKDID